MFDSSLNRDGIELLLDSGSDADPSKAVHPPNVVLNDGRKCKKSKTVNSCDFHHRTVSELAPDDWSETQVNKPAFHVSPQHAVLGR